MNGSTDPELGLFVEVISTGEQLPNEVDKRGWIPIRGIEIIIHFDPNLSECTTHGDSITFENLEGWLLPPEGSHPRVLLDEDPSEDIRNEADIRGYPAPGVAIQEAEYAIGRALGWKGPSPAFGFSTTLDYGGDTAEPEAEAEGGEAITGIRITVHLQPGVLDPPPDEPAYISFADLGGWFFNGEFWLDDRSWKQVLSEMEETGYTGNPELVAEEIKRRITNVRIERRNQ